MLRIAITGLSGEVGSAILELLLSPNIKIIDLYHSNPSLNALIDEHVQLDLTETKSVGTTLEKVAPDVIIHLAGITHIDRCEKDKPNGKSGITWKVNVEATSQIAQYSAKTGTRLIFLSTECVFDGNKSEYLERDHTSAKNWYGVTKESAEKEILSSHASSTIIRAVIAYSPMAKNTLWQQIAKACQNGQKFKMATDCWITPTYLPDIAQCISKVIDHKHFGIFHCAPIHPITPYEFGCKVQSQVGYSRSSIIPSTLQEIMGKQKASLRLRHASLKSVFTRRKLGLKFTTIDEVIQ